MVTKIRLFKKVSLLKILATLSLALGLSCSPSRSTATASSSAQGQAETFTVKKVSAQHNIEISGHIEPIAGKSLTFARNGRVEQVFVKEGSRVFKGALLAKLYSFEAEYNLKNIQNQIQAKRIAGANKDLELLLLQEKAAIQDLEDCYLKAPFAGVITEVNLSPGDLVGNNSGYYIRLIDNSKYQATVEVDELDAVSLKVGQRVSATFDALPGKLFAGRVLSVPLEGKVNSQSIGVLEIVVVFENLPSAIKAGFSFSGQILVDANGEILVVPKSAVIRRNNRSLVLVVAKNSGQLERREIIVSDYNSEYYKVEQGLTEGEEIMASAGLNTSAASSRQPYIFSFPMGPEGGGQPPQNLRSR